MKFLKNWVTHHVWAEFAVDILIKMILWLSADDIHADVVGSCCHGFWGLLYELRMMMNAFVFCLLFGNCI
jgi:hypothetical protein